MRTSPIARRYARALLELATEQNQLPKVKRDLDDVAAAFQTSPDLRGVFDNPGVTIDNRRKVLRALATRMGLSPMTQNTLLLMADNNRFTHIVELAEAFSALAEGASGAVSAEVTTPAAMPASFYTQLQSELEKATGRKVSLVKKEDPSLIAGAVTRVGDKVYDGSMRNRLQQIRESLLS